MDKETIDKILSQLLPAEYDFFIERLNKTRRYDFSGMYLARINLEGCDLSGINFSECTLREAKLRRAKLSGAILLRSSLIKADLRETDLSAACLQEATLSNARLEGSILKNASTFYAVMEKTKLPKHLGFRYDSTLKEKIRKKIEKNTDKLQMSTWHHTCGTVHCLAGWAVKLHPDGKRIEAHSSTYLAGRLLLKLNAEESAVFFSNKEAVLNWLKT